MPTSDDALARLVDRAEIEEVLARYCRGVDRGDEGALASVYHPDATDDHGTFTGPAREFATWAVGGAAKVWHSSHHTVHNVMIDWLSADVAHVESYVLGLNRRLGDPGAVEVFAGRYLDRFERRHGEWKIAHRKAIRDVDTLLDRRGWAGKIPEGGRLPDDWLYRPEDAGLGGASGARSD
jgi:ketosteroid isomerase-like protein